MNGPEKFLIIGINGLVGEYLCRELGSRYSVTGTYRSRPVAGAFKCDITSEANVKEVFNEVKPTHVIHCANLAGGVPYCQTNAAEAERLHFEGTKSIGRCCLRYGAKLVFISTECVFDGRQEAYSEDDPVNPLSIYGMWKAASEAWIRKEIPNHVIVRTMSVFGWQPQTKTPNAFMNAFLEISAGRCVYAPTHKMRQPTYVRYLARALRLLSEGKIAGLFHFAGDDFVNRYEWLRRIFVRMGWDTTRLVLRTGFSEEDSYHPPRVKFNCQKYLRTFPGERLGALDEALVALADDVKAYAALDAGCV